MARRHALRDSGGVQQFHPQLLIMIILSSEETHNASKVVVMQIRNLECEDMQSDRSLRWNALPPWSILQP
jgi:hypothetical protein